MERFNLTRYDLMCMTWTQLVMLFEATVTEEDDGDVEATPEMYDSWA